MDPTSIVVQVLSDALDVEVSTKAPAERPGRLVTVDLAGDQSTPFVLRPRFEILCWGRTDEDAHGIARACLDALWDAAMEHPYLSACQLDSMARDQWSKTGQSRYLIVADITINIE